MKNDQIEKKEETNELSKTIEELHLSPKFTEFLKCYNDKDSTETFGNATRSAIKAYGLDETTQYNYARNLGSKLVTKSNMVARDYLERKGWTYQKFLELVVNKAATTNVPKYMQMLGEMAGYYEEKGFVLNQTNNTQINVVNMNSPEIKHINDVLKKTAYDIYKQPQEPQE